MKKILVIILSLAICFSGCGWNVEIVDPREETVSLEKEPEAEEISEDFIEKIILDFGAVKKEDGTFESEKIGGFLYDMYFEKAYSLETKYYFYWATGKFVEKYSDYSTRFASPHGIGYSFPAEEFEELIESYFGVNPERLREDTSFYDGTHNAYCSPGASIGGSGSQYEIKILSHTKIEDELVIYLSVGGAPCYLNVLLTENGGYRFLSYLPEKIEEPEFPMSAEGEALSFCLGSNNLEASELTVGDSIGDWVLEELEVTSHGEGIEKSYDSVLATFSGTVTLEGLITLNPYAGAGYDFRIRNSDGLDKIPKIAEENIETFIETFRIGLPEVENLPELKENESFPCYITIDSYTANYAATEAMHSANVVKIEPIVKNTGLSEFHEEIIVNFGGEISPYYELGVNKGVSLYYIDEGVEDFSKESATIFYSWLMSKTYVEDRIEVSLPGFREKVYAYSGEFFESEVMKYFDVSEEQLRDPYIYYEEQNCYFLDGHVGIGDTPALVVSSIEESEDKIAFHLTLDYSYEDDRNMVLTVKLLPEGGYNYISYLPE
ncbi:MAG: hypothetical protein J6C34_04220 [Oscillospiraceae bacterium]|nr:hypothetical protein [Oscillospiraceae bacterium]